MLYENEKGAVDHSQDLKTKKCCLWWENRNKSGKLLIGIIVVITAIAIVATFVPIANHLKGGFHPNRTQQIKDVVCQTTECDSISLTMLTNMDFNVHPCDDFYKFACGGWDNRKYHNNVSKSTIDDQLAEEIDQTIKELLEAESIGDNHSIKIHFKMLKTYYKSCTDFGSIPAESLLQPLGQLYNVNQVIPNEINLTETLARLLQYGQTPFFDVTVQINSSNSSHLIILVSSPSHYSLLDLLINETDPAHENMLDEWLDSTLYMQLDNSSQQRVKTFVADLQKITPQMKEIIEHEVDVIMTIKDLQKTFEWIDWKMLLGILFNRRFDDQDMVEVSLPKYLKDLNTMLQSYSPREINNAALVLFVHDSLLNFIHINSYPERWKYCVNELKNLLPLTMSLVYMENVSKALLRTIHDDTKEMFDQLKNTYIWQIKKSHWLSSDAKKAAIDKVKKMKGEFGKLHISFDDPRIKQLQLVSLNSTEFYANTMSLYRINREIQRNFYIQSLTKSEIEKYFSPDSPFLVNAYYVYHFNRIYVSLGILKSPYYTSHAPTYVTYGSLGSTIAHEMFHAFDEIGNTKTLKNIFQFCNGLVTICSLILMNNDVRTNTGTIHSKVKANGMKYDSDGSQNDWMNSADRLSTQNRTTCFKKWYSDRMVIQFKYESDVIELKFDGDYTVNENMADSSIDLAYHAYKSWAQNHPSESNLPGIHLTKDQIFFLSAAQTSCSVLTVLDYIRYYQLGNHLPDPERVNGYLMNSVEFAKVFQCPSTSRMNPTAKCHFW